MAIYSSGVIENRGRDMKSLVVRTANLGIAASDVLLEVFHAITASDGISQQVLYVQRLISVAPDQLHTFDNIYSDHDAVTVRVTTTPLELGQDAIAVSVAARDMHQRVIPGFVTSSPVRTTGLQGQGQFNN